MEDCSTYLVCDASSIIVVIIRVLLNIQYLVLLLYVTTARKYNKCGRGRR